MQLFAKINGAKKEKEDLVDEKGVGSSNEPGSAEQMGAVGICPHLLIGRFITTQFQSKGLDYGHKIGLSSFDLKMFHRAC